MFFYMGRAIVIQWGRAARGEGSQGTALNDRSISIVPGSRWPEREESGKGGEKKAKERKAPLPSAGQFFCKI